MPELTEDRLINDLRRYGGAVDEAAARFGTPVTAYPGSPSSDAAEPVMSPSAHQGTRRRRPLVIVAAAAVLALVVATAVLVRRDEGSGPVVDTPTTTPGEAIGEPFEDGTVLLWLPYEDPPQFLAQGSTRPLPLYLGRPPTAGCCGIATVNTTAAFMAGGTLHLVDRSGRVDDTGVSGERVIADREAGAFFVVGSGELARYPVSGARPLSGGIDGRWTLPAGWELANDGVGVDIVSGSALVERIDRTSGDHELAAWTLATNEIRTIGRARWAIDATTYPNGVPIVAWVDADCDRSSTGCGLVITDLDTMESRTVARAPWGYIGGGAFSDDGRRLAVFAAGQENLSVNPSADLVVVDVDTLDMQVLPGTNVAVGEPYGSAAWTLDGRSVIFHGLSETRVVDVGTGAIRTLPWEVTYSMATIP